MCEEPALQEDGFHGASVYQASACIMLANVSWPTVTHMVKPRVGRRVRNLGGLADWHAEISVPRDLDAKGSGGGGELQSGIRRCLQVVVTCTSLEKAEAEGRRSRVIT